MQTVQKVSFLLPDLGIFLIVKHLLMFFVLGHVNRTLACDLTLVEKHKFKHQKIPLFCLQKKHSNFRKIFRENNGMVEFVYILLF